MRCANCGFQNMPGSELCGRCSTSLGLATAVIDVHPPRASAAAKRLRRLLPVQRAYHRAREVLHADDAAARARHLTATLPPLPIFVRLIVPGWAHFFLKQPIRGHLFLWSFVACVLAAFFCLGSIWSGIWLGMAFSVHSSAALDIVTQTFTDAEVRDRIVRSLIVSAVLGMVVYWPVLRLIGGVAQPHTIESDLTPFRPGDVILVNRWEKPRRGDVVVYTVPYFGPRLIPGHGHNVFWYGGGNIDRVLAVPGDHVQCDSGQLLIDGSPSPWQPLNPQPLPKTLSMTMPDGRYLILPSAAPGQVNLQDANFWQTVGSISRADIVGRAYLQTHPLSQFHVVR